MELYQENALKLHNYYRRKHGSPPLKWSEELAAGAITWANELAAIGKLQHSSNTGCGENLSCCSGIPMSADLAVKSWYSEVECYDFSKPSYQIGTSHFTQVVWKSSVSFGFAIRKSEDGKEFAVARYYPAGNILGQFDRNIFPLGTDLADMPIQPKNEESEFAQMVVKSINQVRAKHRVPSLSLDNEMCTLAKNTSKYFLERQMGVPISSDYSRTTYGRSVQILQASSPSLPDPKNFVDSLYRGEKYFDYSNGCYDSKTAAFTQMVWKSSNKLGVGVTIVDLYVSICLLYSPAGNIGRRYNHEVFEPDSTI